MKKLLAVLISVCIMFSFAIMADADESSNGVLTVLSEFSVMSGDPGGDMRLYDGVSRAECAKIAVSLSEYKDSVSTGLQFSPFCDVPYTHWAAGYIRIAAKNGLCKGYLDGTFRPDNGVTYEEALTIMLKVLGYTDEDFGNSYPDGQIALANRLKMTSKVSAKQGEALMRKDVAQIAYNALKTKTKSGNAKLAARFDSIIYEDAVIVSVDAKNTIASVGTFNTGANMPFESIGQKGDLVVKNDTDAIAFVPSTDIDFTKYIISSALDDSIVVYENGAVKQIKITDGTPGFNEDNTATVYRELKSKLSMGDILFVKHKEDKTIDYFLYRQGDVEGPITVKDNATLSKFGINANTLITRNGVRVTQNDIKTNDIAYFIKDLNAVTVYNSKVTGIYQNALPNKDNAGSIILSDKEYKIESVQAFEKLSSKGTFAFGDTITLLLGKSGGIADVISANDTVLYGFLYKSGVKEISTNDREYTGNYVEVVSANGEKNEYITALSQKDNQNKVVRLTFSGDSARVERINDNTEISGLFDWQNKKLGNTPISADVSILDVIKGSETEAGSYAKIFPQRIDRLNLSRSSVLFCKKDENGNISELILNDVTGDCYKYGIVTEAKENSRGMSLSGSYSYLIDGKEGAAMSNNSIYNIKSGRPAAFLFSSGGTLSGIKPLTALTSPVSEINRVYLVSNGTKYILDDKMDIYLKDSYYNYTQLSIEDIIEKNTYKLTPYYDKPSPSGGRIRVIVATK